MGFFRVTRTFLQEGGAPDARRRMLDVGCGTGGFHGCSQEHEAGRCKDRRFEAAIKYVVGTAGSMLASTI